MRKEKAVDVGALWASYEKQLEKAAAAYRVMETEVTEGGWRSRRAGLALLRLREVQVALSEAFRLADFHSREAV